MTVTAQFPALRMRRLRRNPALRDMFRETEVNVRDLIYPLFVTFGAGVKQEISALPDQYRWSVDMLAAEAEAIARLGIPAVLLFGIPEEKDEQGSQAWNDRGVVQEAIRAIKRAVPEMVVVTDVCLCEYTSHGHCGAVNGEELCNDLTLGLLAREAVSHARAGADIVAPSDMMDGRVGTIRQALDREGYPDTAILAYSAKFASAFYGPFREAAECAPRFGDRRSYQMDPPNGREALREIELDILEGADAVMVKPALAYLDILARGRQQFGLPMAAYNVSGEYSMVKAAAANGWLNGRSATMEILTAIKRAGADLIITYHAKEAAAWLRG